MSVNVSSTTNTLENQFIKPIFSTEVPTSTKFNTLGTWALTQTDIISAAIGNLYLHGIPNLGGAIGDPRTLAPSTALDPDDNLGIVPKIFDSTNVWINEIACSVSAVSGGVNTLTLSSNIKAANIMGTVAGANPVKNVVLATKSGGYIDKVYTGIFLTPAGHSVSADVSSLTVAGLGLAAASSGYYILVINYSLSDILLETMKNIGGMDFAFVDGFISPTNDELIDDSIAGIPNLSSMVEHLSNKTFTARWHIRVQKDANYTISGGKRYWAVTAASYAAIISSHPAPAVISSYINLVSDQIGVGGYVGVSQVVAIAAANGCPILANGTDEPITVYGAGAEIGPTLTGGTLTFGIDDSLITRLPTYIDFYIPMEIPYHLLQSVSLSYDNEEFGMEELFRNVIGSQYAWTNSAGNPTEGTIANRLDSIEDDVEDLESDLASVEADQIADGSFEHSTPGSFTSNTNWVFSAINGGTCLIDNTTQAHGNRAAKITGANDGGGTLASETLVPWSADQDVYVKFKTMSSITTAIISVWLRLFDSSGGGVVGVRLTDGTVPAALTSYTSWKTFFAKASAATIVANKSDTRYISISVRAMHPSPSASTWFDDIRLFKPASDGQITKYRSANTYTVHTGPNCIALTAELLGAGGGGGDDFGTNGGDGGGGGGCIKICETVSPDTDYTLIVGAGGAGAPDGTSGAGSTGAATTFLTWEARGGIGAAANSGGGGAGGQCYKNGVGMSHGLSGLLWWCDGSAGSGNNSGAGGAGGTAAGGSYLMAATNFAGGAGGAPGNFLNGPGSGGAGSAGAGNGGGGGGAGYYGGAGGDGAPGAANIYS